MNFDINSSDLVVMTLDAGGTNFVFSAIQRGVFIVEECTLPSYGHDLEKSLNQLLSGFTIIQSRLSEPASAISFAFPGPADYPNGMIGDLVNLPGYRGGVPLGSFLEYHFNIPVFINNDGDLFAYGEAMYGFLPFINRKVREAGSSRQYHNLVGVTLGTGFGGGAVIKGRLLMGDNSAAAEVWSIQHPERPDIFAEEGLSIRGIKRIYEEFIGEPHNLEPIDISRIAAGLVAGNQEAAIETFKSFGNILGSTLANILTLFDASVVIGGGIAASYPYFIEQTLSRLNGYYRSLDGRRIDRMEIRVFNLENEDHLSTFVKGSHRQVQVPGTDQWRDYDPLKRVAIGKSVLGTSRAIALGAYAYALQQLSLSHSNRI